MTFHIKQSGHYHTEDTSDEWALWKESSTIEAVFYIVAAAYKKFQTYFVSDDFIRKENK